MLVELVEPLSERRPLSDLEFGLVELRVAERARFSRSADEFVRMPDLQKAQASRRIVL